MNWLGDIGSAILGGLYEYRLVAGLGGVALAVILAIVARRRGWVGSLRRHPRAALTILLPTLALALPLGWYLTSPLVLSASIDEPAPSVSTAPTPSASRIPPPASVAPGTSEPPASAAPTAVPVPLLARSGPFHGSDEFHFGRGTARLIEVEPGRFVVRLEDFAVRNGPDLYVYISPSPDGYASGAIELGRLKADRGNQNYEVPAGILDDPAVAASVVIWCKQFSHLFATAPLAPA